MCYYAHTYIVILHSYYYENIQGIYLIDIISSATNYILAVNISLMILSGKHNTLYACMFFLNTWQSYKNSLRNIQSYIQIFSHFAISEMTFV